jgi:hypothetical protein
MAVAKVVDLEVGAMKRELQAIHDVLDELIQILSSEVVLPSPDL